MIGHRHTNWLQNTDHRQPRLTRVERQRLVSWPDPSANIAAVTRLGGLGYLQAIHSGRLPRPPLNEVLDFTLAEITEGHAVFTAQVGDHLSNGLGGVHGGALATLCDGAIGCAVHSTLPEGSGYATVELTTRFLRPVDCAHGEIRCTATVTHRGRRMAVARADVQDTNGKLLAEASATCLLSTTGSD
jgi:uncharacterized protein (TIGR00369 family)